ncbi:MAG TPA: hypothetical protein VLF79_00815 [Candidatus Saccharimonadales bacterium]|nr:hypothetical protein [Candidatus Saccharimonadales bacterium]
MTKSPETIGSPNLSNNQEIKFYEITNAPDRPPGFDFRSSQGSVECSYGYYRDTGSDFVFEPEVLSIDEVDAYDQHQNKGVGTELIASAIKKGREKGFNIGRSDIVNPFMIKLFERLRIQGVVHEIAYIRSPLERHQRMDTHTALSANTLHLSPDEAETLIRTTDSRDASTHAINNRSGTINFSKPDEGYIDCVFTF